MSGEALSLILDVAILICLGITIYYAFVLSRSLNNFRRHRKDFETLIGTLSQNIEAAQGAIDQMKDTSQSAGMDLQDLIDDSRMLADELQLMNEAGNSLAKRLESLAERNRLAAQGLDTGDVDEEEETGHSYEPPAENGQNAPSFFIQDRDYNDDEDADDGGFLSSQAGKGAL